MYPITAHKEQGGKRKKKMMPTLRKPHLMLLWYESPQAQKLKLISKPRASAKLPGCCHKTKGMAKTTGSFNGAKGWETLPTPD